MWWSERTPVSSPNKISAPCGLAKALSRGDSVFSHRGASSARGGYARFSRRWGVSPRHDDSRPTEEVFRFTPERPWMRCSTTFSVHSAKVSFRCRSLSSVTER